MIKRFVVIEFNTNELVDLHALPFWFKTCLILTRSCHVLAIPNSQLKPVENAWSTRLCYPRCPQSIGIDLCRVLCCPCRVIMSLADGALRRPHCVSTVRQCVLMSSHGAGPHGKYEGFKLRNGKHASIFSCQQIPHSFVKAHANELCAHATLSYHSPLMQCLWTPKSQCWRVFVSCRSRSRDPKRVGILSTLKWG